MLTITIIIASVAILVHLIAIPNFFSLPKKPITAYFIQFVALVIPAFILAVLWGLFEGDISFKEFLPFGLLTGISSLLIFDYLVLYSSYNANYSESVFKKGLVPPEDKSVEIEKKSLEIDSKNSEIEKLKFDIQELKSELQRKDIDSSAKEKMYQERIDALSIKQRDVDYEIKLKMTSLEQEIESRLNKEYHHKMAEFIESIADKAEQRILSEKKSLVEDVFNFNETTKDDFFELKKTRESIEKEKAEIEKNKFLLEVDERVSKAREHVLDAKTSALEVKSENIDLRSDLKIMSGEFKMELLQEKSQREKSFDGVIHKLELEEERRKSDFKDVGNKIALLAEQTKGQIIQLASVMSDNLKDLEMRTMSSFREVRENMSEMKLQFGQEVLRLDGQQGQILNELEKYYIKNQEFVNKCQNLALEARSQNIEGHSLLNQVNYLYSQHKLETKAMENQLQISLDKVAVKEGHLANSIGESMLKLKSVSDEQYIAMKDLALEKKDINLLWKEKNQEHEMNLQEVRHQKNDLERMKQFVDQEKAHFNDDKSAVMDNARLTHQLYMNEHRYVEAIKRAESSNGFLTRIAKGIEQSFSRS